MTNPKLLKHSWLSGMYADGYFPDHLVDRVRDELLDLCGKVEARQPKTDAQMLALTHAATEVINDIADEFYEHDSEFETAAREETASDFGTIVDAYGFGHLDVEDVIAPREW